MSTIRLEVCVLATIAAAAIAFLDPMLGAGVFGGAAVAAAVFAMSVRCPTEESADPAAGTETVEALLSTKEFDLPPEVRRPGQVRLKTTGYLGGDEPR
jgi:hypothetical protein